jgi:small subunit ribosomal protein S16
LAVKLRLTRFGRLNHPTYRVCAADARSKRDGRVIETLGYYLPKAKKTDEQFKLNTERISYWLSVGAQPSETVASLIQRSGLELPTRARRVRKKGKARPFTPPRRLGKGRLAKARWRAKHEKSES